MPALCINLSMLLSHVCLAQTGHRLAIFSANHLQDSFPCITLPSCLPAAASGIVVQASC